MAALKIPKNLAKCADMYATLRNERLAQQKIVDAIEEDEKALRAHLLLELPRAQMNGVAGQLVSVEREVVQEPTITDKEALYKYIKKHNAFDLLLGGLNATAVKARWDAKQKVAGVGVFPVEKLRVHKI